MRARMLVGLVLLLGTAPAGAAVPARASDPVWVWPVSGSHVVSRPFDPPSTRYGPGHRGADLAGAAGQPVLAAGAGRVSYAGLLAGRGVVVVVHGSLRTTYEPVTARVRVGQQVAAGQPLGLLVAGHAGCPGPCLHWGLLRGDVYLDPVQLVARGPSRLLPVDSPLAQATAAGPPALLRTRSVTAAEPTPTGSPSFGLRAADVGWGGLALLALVLGLALLLRPRRPPAGPAAPAGSLQVPPAPELVDLAAERHRRRAGVA